MLVIKNRRCNHGVLIDEQECMECKLERHRVPKCIHEVPFDKRCEVCFPFPKEKGVWCKTLDGPCPMKPQCTKEGAKHDWDCNHFISNEEVDEAMAIDERDAYYPTPKFETIPVSDQTLRAFGLKYRFTQKDVAAVMEKVVKEISFLRDAGQKEYAHKEDSPFRNFETTSSELDMTREKVLWVYMKKHMDGILAYINGHRSQRESVNGRINDAIVYLILLRAMFEESGS